MEVPPPPTGIYNLERSPFWFLDSLDIRRLKKHFSKSMVVTQNSMREHLGESILLVSRNRWFIMSCGQLANLLNSKKLFVKLTVYKKVKGINV